jgi:hypothetical protein
MDPVLDALPSAHTVNDMNGQRSVFCVIGM